MIPFKIKNPNSVFLNTAVILVMFLLFDVSSSYLQAIRMSERDELTTNQPFKDDRHRVGLDDSRNDRSEVNSYVRDVRADSRQSRIDARDIRSDFKEIRTELNNMDTGKDYRSPNQYSREHVEFRGSRSEKFRTNNRDRTAEYRDVDLNMRVQINNIGERDNLMQTRKSSTHQNSAKRDLQRNNRDSKTDSRDTDSTRRIGEQNSREQNIFDRFRNTDSTRRIREQISKERQDVFGRFRNSQSVDKLRKSAERIQISNFDRRDDFRDSVNTRVESRGLESEIRFRERTFPDNKSEESGNLRDTTSQRDFTRRFRNKYNSEQRMNLKDLVNFRESDFDRRTDGRNSDFRRGVRDARTNGLKHRITDNSLNSRFSEESGERRESRLGQNTRDSRRVLEESFLTRENSGKMTSGVINDRRESTIRENPKERVSDSREPITSYKDRSSEVRDSRDKDRRITDSKNTGDQRRTANLETRKIRATNEINSIRDTNRDSQRRSTNYFVDHVIQVNDRSSEKRQALKRDASDRMTQPTERTVLKTYDDISTLIYDKYVRDENNNQIRYQLNPEKRRNTRERIFERHMANLEKLEEKSRFRNDEKSTARNLNREAIPTEEKSKIYSNGFVNFLQIILVCLLVDQIWKKTSKTHNNGFCQWLSFAKLKAE